MIQVIGLIIAAYTLARLFQAPFQVQGRGGAFVSTVSALGIIVIALLTFVLLVGGEEAARTIRDMNKIIDDF